MLLDFSGDTNVNGLSDPTSLYTLLKWREANRNGDEVRQAMYKLEPRPWKGIMDLMENMHTQLTSAIASQEECPPPSEAEQEAWKYTCNSAAEA